MDDTVSLETLNDLIRIPPFHQYLGIEVVEAEPERVVLRIPPKEEFVGNPTVPAVHGGIISALIDLSGGAALFAALAVPTPTIDMRVDFLRPAFAGKALTADARAKTVGKTVAFVDVEVTDEDDRLVATGRCTYSVKDQGEPVDRERQYPIG